MKTRTVMVKCVVVDSDGFPVDEHGEHTSNPWHVWEKRRKTTKWLDDPKNKKLWKPA